MVGDWYCLLNPKLPTGGHFLKIETPPSVFKFSKLKLGHFCPPPPLFGHCPKYFRFSVLMSPLSPSQVINMFHRLRTKQKFQSLREKPQGSIRIALSILSVRSAQVLIPPPLFADVILEQKVSSWALEHRYLTLQLGHFRDKWTQNYSV